MKRLAVFLALSSSVPVVAQDVSPFVRARVEPAAPVMVGEPVRLVVDVLTPTWFLEPPRFPTLDLPDAIVRFEDRGINLNESIGGVSYAGLEREYLVTPMREGRFEIPSFEVTVVYAVDARPSNPTPLATKPLSFEATLPADARGLGYFVSAHRLHLAQRVEPEPKQLAVGDALRRTVTIEAEGAFAMMLPPLAAPGIDGLAAYPDPPQVEDRAGERGEARVARRVESVAYRLERAGTYELPAIEIAWWETGAKRLRKATAPAIAFSVAAGLAKADEIPLPGETETPGPTPETRRAIEWTVLVRWILAGLVALGLLASATTFLARRVRRLRDRLAEARRGRLDSEAAWFARVRRAARRSDAAATYRALLGWAERRDSAGDRTLDAFLSDARDPILGAEVDNLGRSLYGPPPAAAAWSGDRFLPRLKAARRAGRRLAHPRRQPLAALNPTSSSSTQARENR